MKRISVDVETELNSCSECGYSIGFHVALRREGDDIHVVLLCPHCGSRFEPGWIIRTHTQHDEQIT